ncbi:dihydroorotase family protein [Candidatus Gracilibacteria bacterium]|nr:dihydroorotase family protein [Candidatus Gracilibacteria bacterium]
MHCRAPDHPEREDFASGTAAAAAAGITTILEMPIAAIGVAHPDILNARRELAERDTHVDFGLYAAPGSLDPKLIHALAEAGACAFKIFTLSVPTDRGRSFEGISIINEDDIYRALSIVAETGLICAVHAENDALLRLGREQARAQHLTGADAFIAAHPQAAEAMAVAWMVVLAEATQARVHIVHMTSAWALDFLRLAKRRGVPISAETCPHYLLFDETTAREHGCWAKIAPPLRPASDRAALWAALVDGTLDILASDHAPFLPHEKEAEDILATPSGLPNLEAFPPLMLSEAHAGRLAISHMISLLTARPARLYGLYPQKGAVQPGSDADLVLYDPKAQSTIDTSTWQSRSRGSARIFHGLHYQGRILRTIVRGKTVYQNGQVVGRAVGAYGAR